MIGERASLRTSCRVLERHDDALAKCDQRGLNLLGLGMVPRVQHAPDNGFAHAEALGQFRVWHAALAHSEVQRQLRRKVKWNTDEALTPLQSRWRRDLVTTGNAAGNSLSQTVSSLRKRILDIVPAGQRLGQIREPDVKALAVLFGLETRGIAGGKHQRSSFRRNSPPFIPQIVEHFCSIRQGRQRGR
jgi:hypothetical protein